MWTVVGRISPAGRRRAHNKSSISSTIRPSLQPAGGFTNNLFCLFVCVVVYFCVFLYLRIRVFAFCVVYLCICTYFCIRIHISVCVSVHLCICICATIFVWFVFVSLDLCVLSWWAEDRSSFSRVRPSLQPALGFSNSLRWRQKANTISETMYRFMKILDSLSSEGLEKIELGFSWFVNLNPSFYSTKTVFKKFSSVVRSRKSWTKVRREVQNAI